MQRHAPVGGAFAKVHASFVHEDEEWDAESIEVDRYDARQRERGRRSFVLRALDEQRSLVAFSELLAEMSEAGAPIDVIGSLARVVRDEARHVDLCGRVVTRLGGFGEDAPSPSWVRSDRRAPLRDRILKTVIGSLCIGETISVAMLAGVRESATDPFVSRLLTQMLADESFHSRFGWWWLESERARITREERAMLDAWLPKVLASIDAMRPEGAALAAPYVASPFGSMAPRARAEALDRAIERTILPGLERAGIDGRGAWARRAVKVA